MGKELSPATLARMSPESREKYESLPDEVDEAPRSQASDNGVCGSLEEALSTPAAEGVRYHTEEIVGTGLKFRFRSLNTEEWLSVAQTDADIVALTLCDSEGRTYLDAEGLAQLKKKYDARSYMHMKLVAETHSFCGATLEGLREAAAKNSHETDTTSTS